jgi:hypothetical protein
MDKITHEKHLTKWTAIIEACRSTGIGIRAWCRENNINEKQFYYWQRCIKGKVFDTLKKTESQSQANFVKLPILADFSKNTPLFMSDMIIHVGDNLLELSNTVSEELLYKVLKVMSDVK